MNSYVPFLNVIDANLKKNSFKNTLQDLFDSEERRIIQGTFRNYSEAKSAHHSLVTPSFLIIIEYIENVRDTVKDLLYDKFDVHRFTSATDSSNQLSCLFILVKNEL